MRQKNELRPYQDRIVSHIYNYNEALCVVRPGGGKTISALTAIEELISDRVIRHALVIAPKRVARNVWPDEIAAWAHTAGLRYQVLKGTPSQRVDQLSCAGEYDITIVGIDVLQWLCERLADTPVDHPLFDLLVFDEISKLRDPTGKRAKALTKICGDWRMIWGLTGTLRPNSAMDMFMPARVVTRGKLWGLSFYKWRKQFFYAADRFGYEWKALPGSEDQLNADIAPLVVTLADDEAPQLPALSVIIDRVELPADARQVYHDMHEKLFAKDILAASAAVATGKLAQISNGFIYDQDTHPVALHDAKREWLQDLIESAAGPTLLVYEFVEDLEMMRELLGGSLPFLGRGVGDAISTNFIERWNKGELPFMALHPASGGHGLNLQFGGADMAWIAPTWSPELWEQTIARLHRSGQTKPVIVRVCTAADTVDQMKLNRVHFKMAAQAAFEQYLRDAQALRLAAG